MDCAGLGDKSFSGCGMAKLIIADSSALCAALAEVFEHAGKIARGPKFVAFLVRSFDSLKRVARGGDCR
jgi:hypothetical protein